MGTSGEAGRLQILFLGDVVGRPGRAAVHEYLRRIKSDQRYDLVVANGENAAGGAGLTAEVADELFNAGVAVLTTGNHVWAKREALDLVATDPRVLRPLNYPPGTPGQGFTLTRTASGALVGVMNALGRTFMAPLDCPFRGLESAVAELREKTPVIIVDFHAEATSEKAAMGWWLDGRVSAVIGTHTHVATADERILAGGTAYVTDAGMCGPRDSVIGVVVEHALRRFVQGLPARFEVAKGPVQINGIHLEVDPETGRATTIHRLREEI